jgi:trehalose 6-phosphate synthase
VGLVTPMRDGMNLVAKEYIAAQDPDDPGVLILSRFAGAADECREALLVNPYDPMPWRPRLPGQWPCPKANARRAMPSCMPRCCAMTSPNGETGS